MSLPSCDTKNAILGKLTGKLPSFSYFYGSPKVHKQGVPLRPIIATCGSPQSKLAKWLADILSPLLGTISGSHILHSMDFVDRIRKLGPVKGKIISLDVTALFTNVPLDFVIDNLKDAASSGIFLPPIPIDKFCELVRLCVNATIFTYSGDVYQQRFGVAMGSPLSPILANLCMEFLERNHVNSLPNHIKPIFWVRYVDDIFVIYNHDDTCFNLFLNSINNFIPTIKFTVEYEDAGKLPFLDVMVIHNKTDYRFSFKIYRKPSNTENYIHFYSFHSKNVKSNIVTNMFFRALRLCDPQYLDDEFKHIFHTFKNLGYPHYFIRNCLSRANKQWFNPLPRKTYSVSNNITLPYSQELITTQKTIKEVNNSSTEEDVVNISFRYNNTIRNRLVNNKSKDSMKDTGVYCLPCLDCNQAYIGESGRSHAQRLEEHKRACRLGNSYSAVANHTWELDHRIGFKQSKLVFRSSDRNTRRTVEGALIQLNNTFINNKGSTREDRYTNTLICRSVNIINYNDISATIRIAASPLSPQVSLIDAGTHPVPLPRADPPEPPDAAITIRRSLRHPTRQSTNT